MTAAVHAAPIPAGWLRDAAFDRRFIAGVAALAIFSGAIVAVRPDWFKIVLLLDLWLLGYHHVVATYTRLCFDAESFRRHRFLLFGLPPLVLAGSAGLAAGFGLWSLASLYLYWQWFHYTRQSWGVARVYEKKAPVPVPGSEWANRIAFYALPVWGILHRSHQAPDRFLGAELRVLPVPAALVELAGAAAFLALLWWGVTRLVHLWRGDLPLAHTLYLLSHFGIFFVGYVGLRHVDHGWLVVNVWHNAQYLIFVWLFNTNRFRGGVDPRARLLSSLSQPSRAGVYFACCLAISTGIYWLLESLLAPLALLLVVYQTINFHHYLVDGLIWKVRRPGMQRTLGLSAS